MTLSRRGFIFGAAVTLAVIRTPGLLMPVASPDILVTKLDILYGALWMPQDLGDFNRRILYPAMQALSDEVVKDLMRHGTGNWGIFA